MKVLAFAYACEPGKGSEPGAGWAWVRMIAQHAEVTVITRANNQQAIEAAIPNLPERDALDFVYVDLPPSLRTWKRGQRGIRLYYALWQLAALRTARRLTIERHFDLVWHLTLANAWLGSTASLLRVPFVYGPVGGGVGAPWRLASVLGWSGTLYELARGAARASARYCNPLARLAWARAALILVQNRETRDWLPRRHRHKSQILQHAVADPVMTADGLTDESGRLTAVFAGRLIPWKGCLLALRAVAASPNWRLVVCGDGTDLNRLRATAENLDAGDRVVFRGRLSHAEVADAMARADALLHPSLHDDSPLAVTEALAHGLPVICVDRGGPALLAAEAAVVASSAGRPADVVRQLVEALERVRTTPDMRTRARKRAADISFPARSASVADILGRFEAAPADGSPGGRS